MILCLDIGATSIRAAWVSGKTVKEKKVIATPKTKKQITNGIFGLIDSYAKPTGLCLGVASFIKNNTTFNTCNLNFADVNLKKLLQARYRLPVYVDNDANCAGLGELRYGHARGRTNLFLITLGTGIGGAVIINGQLYYGNGMAGEPGQMLFGGKKLEKLASGPAATEMAKKIGLGNLNNQQLKLLADQGNQQALLIFKTIGEYLGVGLLNASYILDPEIIIVGGGFSHIPYVLASANKVLKEKDVIQRNIKIVRAKLGDDAGLIGAALLQNLKSS